jgi:hypothetical protein
MREQAGLRMTSLCKISAMCLQDGHRAARG